MKYCLISNFQCTSTSNEDSRRFSDCEGGVTWLYFQSCACPEHLCWAQAAGGRCCRSPAPSAAPSPARGTPGAAAANLQPWGVKKHLLQALTRAHIAVTQDSHADGKSGSCFSHSFFKQQAAPRGYLCRKQKKNNNNNLCFAILMDKGILEQRPYNS